jgi:ATP-dependent protease ClpP protease subunit
MAASMAGILLQAGHQRIMGRESWLMIHEASFSASGKTGDVEDTVEWVKAMQERILNIFATRSKMTKSALKRKWTRKNWWISSDEALKLGFVDEIR